MPDPLPRATPSPLFRRAGRHRRGPGHGPTSADSGRLTTGRLTTARLTPSRLDRLRDTVAARLPDQLRVARVAPSHRAVLGAVAVVVAVAAVLGVRLALASAAARPVPVASTGRQGGGPTATPVGEETAGPTAAPSGSPGSAGSAGGPGSALLVHVAGRVRRPGVVRLPAGSRVQDALRAAGGALRGSDLVGINLAQPLADGEQVLVARVGQGSAVSTAGAAGGPNGAAAGQGSSGPIAVDLNTGDVTALDALPGVGPVLAQRIVDWRVAHGRFTSVDELDEVSGIGDKLLAEIRPHVRL